MAKRILSKKPKRKQLSRKLKRKTLNRKKVGKGGNRGGVPNDNNPNNENVIGAIIMSVFVLLIYLIYLSETTSRPVVSGGTGSNNHLYNSLLENECLKQDLNFYEKIKTLYNKNKFEITNDYDLIINDEELLKELSKNKFLNEHIKGKEIHIKNMYKDNITSFINEIKILYPNQELLNLLKIDCINKKVEELNKTHTLSRLQ
jgi:hypothetical protein